VQPPDGEDVRGIAATDHDDVLFGEERGDVVDGPSDQGEVGQLAVDAREERAPSASEATRRARRPPEAGRGERED
jgi:hypothetical protein